MAKDYGSRRPTRRKSNTPKQLFWMLASFLSGYLAATVFDFTSLSSWVSANILAKHGKEKSAARVVAVKEPEVPKPKFEFYTLLTKEGSAHHPVPVAKPAAPLQPKSIAPPAVTVGSAAVVPKQVNAINAKPPVPVVESKPVVVANSTSKETYQIQIASFKNKQDAEHMKAALTLKGFDVIVVGVSQPQGNWFRVIIGPFGSRIAAEKAQLNLAQREHIQGIIRTRGQVF